MSEIRIFTGELILTIAILGPLALWIFLKIRRALLNEGTSSDNPMGIPDAELIYIDEGKKTKAFFNREFEVLGKPDAMYRTPHGVVAIEYKSRRGSVKDSDISQAICAALAARGENHKVVKVIVKTQTDQQELDLPTSDTAVYSAIRSDVAAARSVKKGGTGKANPHPAKCRSCAHRSSCEHATA